MKIYYSLDGYEQFLFYQEMMFDTYYSLLGDELVYGVDDVNNILNKKCHDCLGCKIDGSCFGANVNKNALKKLNDFHSGGTLIAINKNILALIIFIPSDYTKENKDAYYIVKYKILSLQQGIYRVLIDTYENNKYVYFRGGKNSYSYVEKCLDVLHKKSSFIGFDDIREISNELSRYQPREINIDGEKVYINMFEEVQ